MDTPLCHSDNGVVTFFKCDLTDFRYEGKVLTKRVPKTVLH